MARRQPHVPRFLAAAPRRGWRLGGRLRPRSERLFTGACIEKLEDRALLATFASGDWGWAGVLGSGLLGASDTSLGKHATAVDAARNVYVVGSFSGTADLDPGDEEALLTSAGQQDAFLAKFSADGAFLWAQRLGGVGVDAARSVVVTPDQTVVVGGDFSATVDFDPGPNSYLLSSAGYLDAFVAKFDAAGGFLWAGRLGSNAGPVAYGNADARETVNGLAVDGAGTIYATGEISGAATFGFPQGAPTPIASRGPQNTFILSVSAQGAVNWSGTFGGTFINWGNSIAIDPTAKRLVIGGVAYTAPSIPGSDAVDFDPGPGVANRGGVGLGDSYLAVLGLDGSFRWAERFGGTDEDVCNAATFDAAGNIYATGSFYRQPFDADPGTARTILPCQGESDAWLASYSPEGTLRWAQGLGSTGGDYGWGIAVDAAGSLSLVGEFRGSVDFDVGSGEARLTSNGGADAFVLKVEAATGAYVQGTKIGGAADDAAWGVATDSRGGVIVVGALLGDVDVDPGAGVATLSAGNSKRSFVTRLGAAAEETVSIAAVAAANFTFGFKHINEAGAEKYLIASDGMRKYSEWQSPPLTYWGPQANGVEGRLVYKFDFPARTTSLSLKANSPSWDFTREPGGVGKGASSLEVSTDGVVWVTVFDRIATRQWGDDWGIDGALPDAVVGGSSLWIRMRFLVEGAPNSSYTDAQFGRSSTAATANVFEVRASYGGAEVSEGNVGLTPAQFVITRTGPATTSLAVAWAAAGGGADPVDSEDFPDAVLPSGTVVFQPGENRKTLSVFVQGDRVEEQDETLLASLTNAGPATIVDGSASVLVLNDDFSSLLEVKSLETGWYEGDSGVTATAFEIKRNGDVRSPTTVQWRVRGSGSSPADGDDFASRRLPTGTVSFAAGQRRQTITIDVQGDRAFEPDEGFTLVAQAVIGGAAVQAEAAALILNDDIDIVANSFVGIGDLAADRDEGNPTESATTPYTFLIGRSGIVTESAAVRWTVAGWGRYAADARDFVGGRFPSGVASFAPGETLKTVVVAVSADLASEYDEGFVITLTDAVGMRIATEKAFGTIRDDDVPVSIVSETPSQGEGDSGSSTYTFSVTRSGDLSKPLDVAWRTIGAGGLPANAMDFVGGAMPTGKLSFLSGESRRTITIQVAGDTRSEWDERFAVEISGQRFQKAVASAIIVNDDVGLSFLPGARTIVEGNSGSRSVDFVVARSGSLQGTTTVAWAASGSGAQSADAADFSGGQLPSGSLTFLPGERFKTITVQIAADTVLEPDEGFSVTLSGAVVADITQGTTFGTILNDESSLKIVAVDAVLNEGDSGWKSFSFLVTRSNPASARAWVDWAVTGTGATAADAADFVGGTLPSGRVSFDPGEKTKAIQVKVRGDTTIESDESFIVTLTRAEGAPIEAGTAQGTIVSDDSGVSIVASDASKWEGDSAATVFTFVVNRTGASSGIATVGWVARGSGSTPANAVDFAIGDFPSGTIVFNPGETTKTITVAVTGERVPEPDEGFAVSLESAAGARLLERRAIGLIRSDDTGLGLDTVVVTTAEGNSGSTAVTFRVTRSGRMDIGCSVDWGTVGNGGVPADAIDFPGGTFPSGTVRFSPGETVKSIEVPVSGDAIAERDERFSIVLSNAAGGSILVASATGVIRNDDSTIAIRSLTGSRAEGNGGGTPFFFNVERSGLTSGIATVSWNVVGSGSFGATSSDFVGGVLPQGTIVFQPGQAAVRIAILVAGDRITEANEGFVVTLSGASNAGISTAGAEATINNDDEAAVASIAVALAFAEIGQAKAVTPSKPLRGILPARS